MSSLNLMDSDINSVVAEVKDCGVSIKLDLRTGNQKTLLFFVVLGQPA